MEEVKREISDSLKKWNYQVSCETFNNLNYTQVKKIAILYDLDITKTQMELCSELADILKKIVADRTEKTKMCLNEEDPISGDAISGVDKREMMTIEQNGKVYCFQIDNIYQYTKDYNNKNPYTNVPFTEEQLEVIQKEYNRLLHIRGGMEDEKRPMNLSAAVATLTGKLSYASDDMFLKATEEQLQKFFETVEEYTGLQFGNFQNTSEFKINSVYKIADYLKEGGEVFKIQRIWNFIIEKDENYAIAVEDSGIDRFIDAITLGDIDTVKSIVESGEDVNVNNGFALITAFNSGHTNILNFLLENGADNFSKLVVACISGDLDTVKSYIHETEDYDYLLGVTVEYGKDVINVVKFLIESGGDINVALRESLNNNNIDALLNEDIDINIKEFLDEAILYKNLEVIKILVEKGADITSEVLIKGARRGELDIIKYLVEKTGTVDSETLNQMLNASLYQLDVVKYLVELGADVKTIPDEELENILNEGSSELLDYILERRRA
jgi:hypothetical protein